MGKHRFQNATFFLCILRLTFASWAWAQEQTSPAPQAGAKPAKEQLKPEEPEAKGWFITWQPTLTANWEAASGNQWTVLYGGGIGRIMKLGFQPVSLTAQFYGNAAHPVNTPSWTMRLQVAFLFPKLTREQQEMLMEKKLKQMEQQPPTSK